MRRITVLWNAERYNGNFFLRLLLFVFFRVIILYTIVSLHGSGTPFTGDQIMKFNPDPRFAARPDHSHYPACLGRLEAIKMHGNVIFIYTVVVSIFLLIFSIFGIKMSVISWIASAVIAVSGDDESMLAYFSQLLSLAAVFILAYLNYGKRKLCGVILNIVYVFMGFSPLFYMYSPLDIFSVIIGIAGAGISLSAYGDFKDYTVLSETEGFPIFLEYYTAQQERKVGVKQAEERYEQLRRERLEQIMEKNSPESVSVPDEPVPFASPERRAQIFKKAAEKESASVFINDLEEKKEAPAVQPVSDSSDGYGDMPELDLSALNSASPSKGRFVPKSGKESAVRDSGMKMR